MSFDGTKISLMLWWNSRERYGDRGGFDRGFDRDRGGFDRFGDRDGEIYNGSCVQQP